MPWAFVTVHRLPLVAMSRGYLSVAVCGGSRCRGFRSCSTQAYLPHGLWNLPKQGLNLSPALVGRCLTYEPPGKSLLSPSFGALGGGMSTSDLGLCVCIRLSVLCGSRAFLVVDLLDLTSVLWIIPSDSLKAEFGPRHSHFLGLVALPHVGFSWTRDALACKAEGFFFFFSFSLRTSLKFCSTTFCHFFRQLDNCVFRKLSFFLSKELF